MGPLVKTNINTESDIKFAVPEIQKYVWKNNYRGFIMCNASGQIITNPTTKYLHQKFIDSDVFISAQSFQQNNLVLGNKIRKHVSKLISGLSELVCIGGESYLYGLTQQIPVIYTYTNSPHIYSDILYNETFYKKLINSNTNLCDYNKLQQLVQSETCLINLSNLNAKLLNIINISNYNKIIIINCHHEDFWKKIKLLSQYKIKQRKQFVSCSLGYFIAVTVLEKNKLPIK